MAKTSRSGEEPFLKRMKTLGQQKAAATKVPSAKLNEAIGETVLDRMDYPKPKIVEISPEAQAAADKVLDCMDCPLSRKGDWNCNKTKEGEGPTHPYFEQGKEPQCKNGGFVRCPAYHRYFNFRVNYEKKLRNNEERSSKKEG